MCVRLKQEEPVWDQPGLHSKSPRDGKEKKTKIKVKLIMMLCTYDPRTGRLRQEAHCMFESSLDYTNFWNSLGYRISVSPPHPKKKEERRRRKREVGQTAVPE